MPQKIFFDIETLPPAESEREHFRTEYEKSLKTRAFAENLPTFEKYFRDLALDGATGRLLTIGVIVEQNGKVVRQGCLGRERATGKFHLDEARTLRAFWKLLIDFDTNRDLLIGHNALNFDLLFLRQRCAVHRIAPGLRLEKLDKYRTNFVFDTMWQWTNQQRTIGLSTIARGLNLPNPKSDEMDGSKVYEAFLAGRDTDLRDYCLRDVECVRQVYYRMISAVPPSLQETIFPVLIQPAKTFGANLAH